MNELAESVLHRSNQRLLVAAVSTSYQEFDSLKRKTRLAQNLVL